MSPRALVTGATGMLGSYIVEQLVSEDWSVRALVRDPASAGWLARMGAEPARGRLEACRALEAAATGCDVVFHAAAAIGAGGGWEAFRRGNVEGTANVLAAAAVSRARLVHVSSTSVFGRARYGARPTDESVPLPELPEADAYGRSKQEAERLVLDAHASGRQWCAVVRPPVMFGVRDRQFAPRIGPVVERGFFPLVGGGRTTLTLVYAGNVARGAILAAGTDRAGGRVYHLTNDAPIDAALLVECARQALGRRIRAPEVSRRVGRVGFALLAAALRLGGRADLARHAPGTLEMLMRDNPFTSGRAREELGWDPERRPAFRLTEALRWWKAHAAGQEG